MDSSSGILHASERKSAENMPRASTNTCLLIMQAAARSRAVVGQLVHKADPIVVVASLRVVAAAAGGAVVQAHFDRFQSNPSERADQETVTHHVVDKLRPSLLLHHIILDVAACLTSPFKHLKPKKQKTTDNSWCKTSVEAHEEITQKYLKFTPTRGLSLLNGGDERNLPMFSSNVHVRCQSSRYLHLINIL